MARNPNISIGFSVSKSAQEVNKLATDMKTLRKEFEVSSSAIEATGDKTALLENRLKQFGGEAKIVRAASDAMRKGLEEATTTQSNLAAKTETARKAYENAKQSQNKSKEEVEKLKKAYDDLAARLTHADKAVNNWKNKLQDCQITENKLKTSTNQVTKEIDDLNKKQSENIKNTQNVTTHTGKLLDIYTLIKGLALGYAGKTLYEALIGGNAQFEQYMTSFEVLLGGAEQAQKRMDELVQFAAKTPFELPQVTEAEKRLLAYGVAAKDTAKYLPMLGDISMGNAEKLDRISLAYGQVVTNQRLYGTELRQFAENGVPLLDELAKLYGVTSVEMRKMVEDGKIGVDAVNAALESMTSAGGKFFGMMDKQSQTMNGMLATLRDNFGIFARDVGEKSFGYLKGELGELMDTIDQMSDSGELEGVADEWGRGIGRFTEFVIDAVKILYDMRNALIGVGATLAATAILNAAAAAYTTLSATIQTVTAMMKGAKVANEVLNASLIKTPWGAVAAVIGLVIGGLVTYALSVDKATSETDILAEKTKDLTEEYESNKKAADRQANAQLGEVEVARRLTEELDSLGKKVDKTTQDKTRMASIVDQLNNKIPNLKLAIDSETGALNLQTDAIYSNIEALKNQIIAKAYSDKATAAGTSYVNQEDILRQTENQLQSETQKLNELRAKYGDAYDAIKNLREEAKKEGLSAGSVGRAIANINSQYEITDPQYEKQIDEQTKKVKDLTSLVGEQSDLLNQYSKEIDEYTSKAAEKTTSSTSTVIPPPLDKSKGEYTDLEKLKDQFDAGLISAQNYKKQLQEILSGEVYDSEGYYKVAKEIKSVTDQMARDVSQASKAVTKEDKAATKSIEEAYEERLKLSEQWIADQKYAGKLTSDEEIAAYERIKKYTKDYYDAGIINNARYVQEIREQNRGISEAEREAYEERRQFSEQWITDQKYYGRLSSEEEIAAYERIKAYVKEYYDQGIIDLKQYNAERLGLDKDIYAVRKAAAEDAVKDYIAAKGKELKADEDAETKKLNNKLKSLDAERDAETKRLNERLKAIDKEYDEIEKREERQERSTELVDLARQEQRYLGAVTEEGKNKLADIQKRIRELNLEDEKDAREQEKDIRKEAIEQEIEDYNAKYERQKEALQTSIEDTKTKYAMMNEDLQKEQESMLAAASAYALDASKTVTDANLGIANSMADIVRKFDEDTRETVRKGVEAIRQMAAEAANALADMKAPSTTTGGKTAAGGAASGGSNQQTSVTLNDYSNNTYVDRAAMEDKGKETANLIKNAQRVSGRT